MHPILFRIPFPGWKLPIFGEVHSIPIYSYGVMLGLSLVVGWYLTLWLADKDGLPKETMANCYVVTAIAALIGSRVLYIVTNLGEFEHFADFFALRRGGLVAYGGFLGGYLGSWLYLKREKISLMPWADVAVPSLASGLLITRIGCYLFGCDFGRPLTAGAPEWLKKAGTFPHWAQGTLEQGTGSPAWVHHVQHYGLSFDSTASMPVHPTQIYESLIGAALLGIVFLQRKHQRFRGQVFMTFAFAYGLFRFLVEIVRDDAERGLYGPQLAAHILIPGALFAFALGYVLSFSNAVENVQLRRLTQVISFIPAVVAYLMLRPASFADAQLTQLSTSQWVGLLTAVAVSVGFALFWKVAEAHPEQAMAIDLSGFQEVEAARNRKGPAPVESKAEEEQQEEDDEDQPKKPVKAAGRADGAAKVVDAKFDDQPAKDEAKGETKAEAKSDEKPSDEAKSEQA